MSCANLRTGPGLPMQVRVNYDVFVHIYTSKLVSTSCEFRIYRMSASLTHELEDVALSRLQSVGLRANFDPKTSSSSNMSTSPAPLTC